MAPSFWSWKLYRTTVEIYKLKELTYNAQAATMNIIYTSSLVRKRLLERIIFWATPSFCRSTMFPIKSGVHSWKGRGICIGTTCIILARLHMVQMVSKASQSVTNILLVIWSHFRSRKLGTTFSLQNLYHTTIEVFNLIISAGDAQVNSIILIHNICGSDARLRTPWNWFGLISK